MSKIGQYLREYFFKPVYTHNKPRRSEKHMVNIFAYKGAHAATERAEFFDEAYGEILFDLFIAWTNTDPSNEKEREHLYRTVLALGSVKEKLIGYETYGKNLPYLYESREAEEADEAEEEDEENGET